MTNVIITATGSYIPPVTVPNTHFLSNEFYGTDGNKLEKPNPEIIRKLHEITGIKERRWVDDTLDTSDIATFAAEKALEAVDRESLDYIIVAQNLGEVKPDLPYTDIVPTIAARVKHKLKIENPYTVAFDLPFGCPGWLQGMIMAKSLIKAGDAKRILVIGAEILSRVSDPHDVDCMIFADGAGATVVESSEKTGGILAHLTRSDTLQHAYLLRMGKSYNPERNGSDLFIKMEGHEIYKYSVRMVPRAVQENLEQSGVLLGDVKKILIHQANEKMDEAIVRELFKLYKIREIPEGIMPMMISWAGNSSVATLPTLYDRILKGKLDGHRLHAGDIVVFASVGAGMNINSMIYKIPDAS
ncbi:MAG: 3-oxoacyl-ACP synthase [Deltaproteobacteria bacterium SG8_13]|nr:MAG: 3-oxoacyl-ACP synthase [Deltaproteobacteria bacterium SG8_13]